MTAPATKYFDLFCDMSAPEERWYLGGPRGASGELLKDALTSGRKYEGGTPLICTVDQPGPQLELTMTEELVPVLNQRVAEIFAAHVGKDAQLIQARPSDSNAGLWVVNVLSVVDCVDTVQSKGVERWTAADGQPELVGAFKKIEELRIDPARAGGHAIFRPLGWDVAVIISEPLADALVQAGVRCELTPVS